MKTEISTEILNCILTGAPTAKYWIIRPVHGADAEQPERLAEQIRALSPGREFCLFTITVRDWFGTLSPWPAPAVIGGNSFAGRGAETLHSLETEMLPALRARYGAEHACVLAGYSLAGLFALWTAYESDCFSGVAAVSPSLWFPGWDDYAAARTPRTGAVYLSLGDREEKTRNPAMAAVGDAVRTQERLLREQNVPCTLEWNPGNHFQEPEKRMAKGIAWVLAALEKNGAGSRDLRGNDMG